MINRNGVEWILIEKNVTSPKKYKFKKERKEDVLGGERREVHEQSN